MKAGTIARIVNLGILVAVLALILYPVVTTLQEEGTEGVGIGIPAVYDMTDLNTETLRGNIESAIGDSADSYELEYLGTYHPVDSGNIDTVCKEAFASKTDVCTLYVNHPDADAPGGYAKHVVKQQLMMYSNGNYTTMKTGLMSPGLDKVPLDMSMTMGVMDPSGKLVFEGNSTTEVDENGLIMNFYLPTVPMVAAMAAGYDVFLMAHTGLEKIFTFDLDLDIGGGQIECTVKEVLTAEVMNFDTYMAGDCMGTIGGSITVVSGSHIGLTVTGPAGTTVSEALRTMAADGDVEINLDGKTYSMSSANAVGLADIFEVLEEAKA